VRNSELRKLNDFSEEFTVFFWKFKINSMKKIIIETYRSKKLPLTHLSLSKIKRI